ncbi:MAG: tetratricopeptide repeat protein [Wolinella sp.]
MRVFSAYVFLGLLGFSSLSAQEPSAFGTPAQEQEMQFESVPLSASTMAPLQISSAVPARQSTPKNTTEEIADIKERLFNITSSLKMLEESQEGLKSVLEGQNKRLQGYSRSSSDSEYATTRDLNTSIGQLTETLNANFTVYDENFKTLKDSIKALGELIDKMNKTTKADIDSLRADVDEIRKAAGIKPKNKSDKGVQTTVQSDSKGSNQAKLSSASESINFSKQDSFTVYKEATELLDQGKLSDAKARLEWTAKNQYKPASSNYLLGEISFREKRYKDAIYYYKESATLYDKAEYMPRLLLNSAKSFKHTGDKENSRRFLETIVSLYPDSAEANEAEKLLK